MVYVSDPTDAGLDSIIDALDADLADPTSGASQLLGADPTRVALAVAHPDRHETVAELLSDPALGRVRPVPYPIYRGGSAARWQCSCGHVGETPRGGASREAVEAHLAMHRHEYAEDP